MRNQASARSGWRQWGEAEAREMLDAFSRSGKTMAAFARSRGFSVRRMEYWRRRLVTSPAVAFVPVTLPALAHAAVAPEATIAITLGDVTVRVREDLDIERVARLVVAIAGRGTC